MEPAILLAQLRALIERVPNLENYSPSSREQQLWLGQAHALISRWNKMEASSFQTSCNFLAMEYTRANNIGIIFGALYRAIADLEIQVPTDAEVNFGAGDVYSFFKALNKIIASAEQSLFIVDPYLDETVFDHYLTSRKPEVNVRLMLNHKAENILPAAKKYIGQYGSVLELKKSNLLHDRVVFVDGYICWLIGQSVKDAAKAKPTYLVPLPPDVVPAKLENYNQIWVSVNLILTGAIWKITSL